MSTEHGAAPLAVELDASASAGGGHSSGEGIAAWTVSFGDGTPDAQGTGAPPADLRHTFSAGTRTVRLTITDTAGCTASDARTIVAASPPAITGTSSTVTGDTSAMLNARVHPHSLDTTMWFELVPAGGGSVRTAPVTVVAHTGYRWISVPISGLAPGTTYSVQAVATNASGSGASPGGTFTTAR